MTGSFHKHNQSVPLKAPGKLARIILISEVVPIPGIDLQYDVNTGKQVRRAKPSDNV